MGSPNDMQFAVTCPHCETKLKVKSRDLGSSKSCPRCSRIFALPSPSMARAAAAKREFSFPCRLCATRMYAAPEQVGTQVECPDCQTVNNVPAPTKPVAAKKTTLPEDDDGYSLQPLEPMVAPSEPAKAVQQFRVRCTTCHSMLYFRTDQVGTFKSCPECDTRFQVPKPQPVLKKPVIVAQDPGITIEPPPVTRGDNTAAQGVLERAKARVDEKAAREELPPIKHPFRDGVWSFPMSLSALPFCIVAGGTACLIVYLIMLIPQFTGLMQIMAVFVAIIAAILSALLALVCSVFWMTTISWTAMGHQKIKEFPKVDLFDWIRTSLFIVNAAGISAAPGALFAALIPAAGSFRSIFAIPSLFALFPIILMSMLEDESPISLYSKTIHESLRKCFGSWLKFYLIAAILSVIVVIPHLVGLVIESPAWNYLAAIVLVVATVIYFRTFGRLAWVINEKMLVESDDGPEEIVVPPPLPDSVNS